MVARFPVWERPGRVLISSQTGLGRRWATSGGGRVRRVPGEPGVTARLYADIRRVGSEGAAAPD
ncbi:DUF6207 family protein [Streptomyces sp. NBC_00057]|uniref:DUF6207 family protein n=1 Tax=Streptomyces sp. NBC_00057 TaxID=2975634 RepID=UPI002F90C9EC